MFQSQLKKLALGLLIFPAMLPMAQPPRASQFLTARPRLQINTEAQSTANTGLSNPQTNMQTGQATAQTTVTTVVNTDITEVNVTTTASNGTATSQASQRPPSLADGLKNMFLKTRKQ